MKSIQDQVLDLFKDEISTRKMFAESAKAGKWLYD